MSSGAETPKEESKPPSFQDQPKEAYEYLQKCYLEARQRGENYRIRAVEVTERLRTVLHKEQQFTILNSEMNGDKTASKVPWYMGTEGGTSAEAWLDNLTALMAMQKWSDGQILDLRSLLAFHGVAGTCKVNEKEDGNSSVTSFADFLVAFLERFSVQSIKLVSDLRQGPSEEVVDFHDCVRLVIMTFGKDRSAHYRAADQEQQTAGYHKCFIDMIEMHFVGGLRPSIRQVVESCYASLTDKVMLLNAAKEAEIAVSVGPDKRLMELEAEIAAFRVSPGSSPGQRGGQAGRGGRGTSRGGG